MTRINVVPPTELSDKHLGAEYRELPRIFGLVRKAIERGERPDDKRNPKHYVLGTGHVRFFYPRLGFLYQRHLDLVAECKRRGRKVSFDNPAELLVGIPDEWRGAWRPTMDALMINRQRIKERTK